MIDRGAMTLVRSAIIQVTAGQQGSMFAQDQKVTWPHGVPAIVQHLATEVRIAQASCLCTLHFELLMDLQTSSGLVDRL